MEKIYTLAGGIQNFSKRSHPSKMLTSTALQTKQRKDTVGTERRARKRRMVCPLGHSFIHSFRKSLITAAHLIFHNGSGL